MKTRFILGFFFIFISCSTLNQSNPEFYGKAVPAKNEAPLPVEIARQIQMISEGKPLVKDNDFLNLMQSNKNKDLTTCLNSEDCMVKFNYDPYTGEPIAKKVEGMNVDESLEFKTNGPLSKEQKSNQSGPLNFRSIANNGKGGKTITYIVKAGDTLMEIAFEKYADYLKWKSIYRDNKEKIPSPKRMQIGTNLTLNNYRVVHIRKVGEPYLIQKNDTLKSIADKLYGNEKLWKKIWKNNPELIKDPKKIYHGFTLYYQEKEANAKNRVPAEKKEMNDTF